LLSGRLYANRVRCGVNRVLREVLEVARRKAALAGLQFESHMPPKLPDIYCDPCLMRRAISTLADHAIKTCNKETPLTIWTKLADDRRSIEVGLFHCGPRWEPQSFKKLTQALGGARTGKGPEDFRNLALTVAHELIGINFGKIRVQRRRNSTNTVRVTLPISEPALIVDAFLDHAAADGTRGANVSVVVMDVNQRSTLPSLSIETCIQYSIPPEDLLLPLNSKSSIVLVRGDEQEAFQLLTDVRESVIPTSTDESLEFRPMGSWNAASQRRELQNACHHIIDAAREQASETA
jgi:hypothetical protein